MHNTYPYYINTPVYNAYNPFPYSGTTPMYGLNLFTQYANQCVPFTGQAKGGTSIKLKDYGPQPFAINIEEAALQNNTFRTALWTGSHLQVTLMSINAGEDIGLEIHPGIEQFVRIEEGQGLVVMGDAKDKPDFQEKVYDGFAFIIPAGKWHNLINTGCRPLKLYSVYAPPQHPKGTVHATKAVAEAAEESHMH